MKWKLIASGLMAGVVVLTPFKAQQKKSIMPIQPSIPQAQSCDDNPGDGYTKSITGNIDGDPLEISVSTRFAGSVDSLTWRGKEFINNFDHGREISYAWHMNGYGECLNPTEPGSANDGVGPTSSSRLLSVCRTAENKMTTTTQLAYWLAPNQNGFCSGGLTNAINNTVLSQHILEKTMEIGYQGIDNVISFTAEITPPEDYDLIQMEIPTGYQTYEFNNYWVYDLSTGELTKPESIQPTHAPWSFEHYGNFPPILATQDNQYAMGAYSAEQILGYGIFGTNSSNPIDRTNKWHIVARESPALAKTYTYQSFVIVGTLEQVQESIQKLYNLHPVDYGPPTGFIDFANCDEIAGWAWDPKAPNQPIAVEFYAQNSDGTETFLARIEADSYREDLETTLRDNGNHGFFIPTSEIIHDNRRVELKAYAINSNPNLLRQELNKSVQALECSQFGPPVEPTITFEPTVTQPTTAPITPTADSESKPAPLNIPCAGTALPLIAGIIVWTRRRIR